MYFPSQFEYMHRRASIQKQTDVSTMLAKQHVFFSKFESTESNPNDANMVADGSTMGGPRLSVANGAWIDQTLDFNPSFKQVIDNVYKAAAASVDFQNKADEVAAEINKWAEEKTNGLIKKILPPDAVDGTTSLVLGNALYFKGAWTEKLNASDTKDHEFHLLNTGVSVQAPFMTRKKWQYVKAYNGFKVLRLPYKQGEDKRFLSMYMFLPNDRDGLPALMEKINSKPGFLDQHVPLQQVRVRKFLIPKFKILIEIHVLPRQNLELAILLPSRQRFTSVERMIHSDRHESPTTLPESMLYKVLNGLGLTLPFIDGLTEMVVNDFPLVVSKVFHKSFIEVMRKVQKLQLLLLLQCYAVPL
ncbi:hypothetical protein P3S68_006584 [Capsicum galapagoense]